MSAAELVVSLVLLVVSLVLVNACDGRDRYDEDEELR